MGSNLFAGLYGMGVYISTNNGKNWNPLNNGLSDLWIGSIIVSGSNLFVGSQMSGVYYSTDNGLTWTNMELPKSAGGALALVVNGSYLYAGTFTGIWRYPI
jgi:photosystem II stability/assembly factor-like uncharacterized protein